MQPVYSDMQIDFPLPSSYVLSQSVQINFLSSLTAIKVFKYASMSAVYEYVKSSQKLG